MKKKEEELNKENSENAKKNEKIKDCYLLHCTKML